jgi:hypothetical protein
MEQLVQASFELPSIRQPGQLIMGRLVGELGGEPVRLGDVFEHDHLRTGRRVRGMQACERQLAPDDASVRTNVAALQRLVAALAVLVFGDELAQIAPVPGMGKMRQELTAELTRAALEEAGHRLVVFHQDALGIDQRHPDRRLLERGPESRLEASELAHGTDREEDQQQSEHEQTGPEDPARTADDHSTGIGHRTGEGQRIPGEVLVDHGQLFANRHPHGLVVGPGIEPEQFQFGRQLFQPFDPGIASFPQLDG